MPQALKEIGKVSSDIIDITFGTKQPCFVPDHTHPTTNYGVVTEGALYLTLGGEEKAYKMGDWFHVPAEAEHAERFEEDTSVVVFWLKSSAGGR